MTGTQAANVFARTVSAPPGLPWDQARIADLDARAGAPLPLSEVAYRLRRLEPWAPGRVARYAAFYVRAREIGDRLLATASIDGQALTMEFVSASRRARQARRLATVSVTAALVCLAAGGATVTALSARAGAEARLAVMQQAIDLRLREVRAARRLDAQSRALTMIHVRGLAVDDYLNDLAWVSRTRAPASHIDSVRWDHGYLGVESRGDVAPFGQTDRRTLRAEKPVRQGVWLWAVGPAVEHRP